MEETEGQTLFVVGDYQVGKTTISRRLFENQNLIFVSSEGGATEYQVFLKGREFPVRILEIQHHAYLAENSIDFDDEIDLVFFCYAIDNPYSFQRIQDKWIPLFNEHVCDSMPGVLLGNKKDLRHDNEVLHNLAERGLQPVSTNQGFEVFDDHDTLDAFVEWGMDDIQPNGLLENFF